MGKLRIKTEFAQTPNKLLKNKEVSLKAKGLYAFIHSKSNGWEFSAVRISMELKEGLQAINSTLQELEESKYLQRHKYQNNKGHWKVDYELHIEPYIKTLCTETPIQENPSSDNPVIGKHPNKERKNLERKNIINKEKERKVKTARFVSPTIDDIFNYMTKEKGKEKSFAKKESEKMFNFYESKGWLVGKAKMKNWKAAASNWIARAETDFATKDKPAFKLNTNRPT